MARPRTISVRLWPIPRRLMFSAAVHRSVLGGHRRDGGPEGFPVVGMWESLPPSSQWLN